MTAKEIIATYYQSKEINEAIRRVTPPGLTDDTKQHVFEILLKQPDYVLINLHDKDQLKFYIIRILLTTVRGKRNAFERLHKQPKTVYDETVLIAADGPTDSEEYEKRLAFEKLMQECMAELDAGCAQMENREHWYNMNLLREYLECGSYRCVEAKLGIGHKTVFNAVRKAKEFIKAKLCNQ